MSDAPANPAPGAGEFRGLVRIDETSDRAMITLRGDLSLPALVQALQQEFGLSVPQRRSVETNGERGLAWMSPDELLLILPDQQRAAAMESLRTALADAFVTVADVSDARAVFVLRGAAWREVLAKLCPVDLHPDSFGPGQIRRTRAAQGAVAFWTDGEATAVTLVCFRSVAAYMAELLANAARPGSDAGLYASAGG